VKLASGKKREDLGFGAHEIENSGCSRNIGTSNAKYPSQNAIIFIFQHFHL